MFHPCGGEAAPELWVAPDGTKLYKADLGNPANVGDTYECKSYDSIDLTQLMAIPYGYAEPPFNGPSTPPLSVEQLQDGSYGSQPGLVYIDCIDWYPLPNKSAPWRRAFMSRSLDSKKSVGIGGIESLFFKTRTPSCSSGFPGSRPWSDISPPDNPNSCDDSTYVPLDASNSCPIPPPDYLADIDLMTAFVDGVGASPRYYDFSPRWRYWTTQYILNLPQDFQGTIRFDITRFPLAPGYTRDPVQVEGGGIPGAPAANNSITVSSLKGGSGAEGGWTDEDWSNPTFYNVHFTTTYYASADPSTPITKEYEVELLRTI